MLPEDEWDLCFDALPCAFWLACNPVADPCEGIEPSAFPAAVPPMPFDAGDIPLGMLVCPIVLVSPFVPVDPEVLRDGEVPVVPEVDWAVATAGNKVMARAAVNMRII